MFKEKFIKLCADRGESPSSVCKKIGITAAAFSQWTDQTVPRVTTQIKAADYFGVNLDYFKEDSPETPIDSIVSAAVTAARSPEIPFTGINYNFTNSHRTKKRFGVRAKNNLESNLYAKPGIKSVHKYGTVLNSDKEKVALNRTQTLQREIINLVFAQKDEQKLESIKMMLQALK